MTSEQYGDIFRVIFDAKIDALTKHQLANYDWQREHAKRNLELIQTAEKALHDAWANACAQRWGVAA